MGRTVVDGGKFHISEKDFQKQVLDLARTYHWLGFHDTDSRKNARGLPDLILCRPPRLLFCELKTEKGRLRPDQKIWLEALRSVVGIEVYTWKPHDMEDILRILQ